MLSLTVGGLCARFVISFEKVVEEASVFLLYVFSEGSGRYLPGSCGHKCVFGVCLLGDEIHHDGNRGVVQGVLSVGQSVNYAFNPFPHDRP